MPEQNKKPDIIKSMTMGMKVSLITRMLWAIVILFGMFGMLIGRTEQAVAVFVVSSVVWCCTKVLMDGVLSYFMWLNIIRIDKDDETKTG